MSSDRTPVPPATTFADELDELAASRAGIAYVYEALARLALRHRLRDAVIVLEGPGGPQVFRLDARPISPFMAARLSSRPGLHCDPPVIPDADRRLVVERCAAAVAGTIGDLSPSEVVVEDVVGIVAADLLHEEIAPHDAETWPARTGDLDERTRLDEVAPADRSETLAPDGGDVEVTAPEDAWVELVDFLVEERGEGVEPPEPARASLLEEFEVPDDFVGRPPALEEPPATLLTALEVLEATTPVRRPQDERPLPVAVPATPVADRRVRGRRAASLALVAFDLAALALTLLALHDALRFAVGLVFGLAAPGWAIVGWLRLRSVALEVGLSLAMSLTVIMLGAQILMTAHLWHLAGFEIVLGVLCLPSLLGQALVLPTRGARP